MLEAKVDGEKESSIFDMWYKKNDGSEVFTEIKYESDLEKEEVVQQIKIQKTWCELNGKNT